MHLLPSVNRSPAAPSCAPAGGAVAASRCSPRRLHVCDALRLVPTGPGTTDHLDDDVVAPGAISLTQGLYEVSCAAVHVVAARLVLLCLHSAAASGGLGSSVPMDLARC